MKEIEILIKDFLNYSSTYNVVGWEDSKDKLKTQDEIIEKLKELAKQNKTLLGRIITFPHADSYAMYVITKINKKSVRLTWVDYCDGWVDQRLGKLGSINMWYAKQEIGNQDMIEKIFPPRKRF